MDLVHCILGKFLVFPTFVTRCLYVCKDAREPSGRNWNYLSKIYVTLQKWSLFRHLCKCLCNKCTSYTRWQWSYQLGVCFQKNTCDKPLWKSTEVRNSDFVMCIAPTGDIHVLAIELLYICRKWSRIMTSANLIWSYLIFDMNFYSVEKGL
jgi:hypothetical protein